MPQRAVGRAVDDLAGVVIDAEVTSGETSEGRQLQEQLARIEETTGQHVKTVTADGSSDFKAESGRYHLYVSYACPWCSGNTNG